MKDRYSDRICVGRDAIRHLEREGLGWGHDLDCGCFRVAGNAVPRRRLQSYFARLARRIGG